MAVFEHHHNLLSIGSFQLMSDIEILEERRPNATKRKQQSVASHGKRKRTTSGLIEKSGTMKGTETEFEEFVIDRTITSQRKLAVKDVEESEKTENASQWRKRLESTLLGFEPEPETQKRQNRFKKSCFNCDGEHNLRDCLRPKDFRRISRKKRESGDESRRNYMYDNVGLSKQKQTNFKPGELSDKLRAALGLQINDIPEHIYRMRRLGFIKGYPPGWLKKAIKSTEMLKYYTTESKNNEEKDSAKPPELDTSKIVWYPGFNSHSSKLKDREAFKIPEMDVFSSVYQDELTDIFKKRQKAEKKRSKSISKHIKFVDNDDDVIIVEQATTIGENDKFKTPGEDGVVVVLNSNESTAGELLRTPIRKDVKMGASMFEIIGTPIFDHQHRTPAAPLEAFAVGIEPFQARDEEVANKGYFRKLMNELKKIRELGSEKMSEPMAEFSSGIVLSPMSLPEQKGLEDPAMSIQDLAVPSTEPELAHCEYPKSRKVTKKRKRNRKKFAESL